MPPRKSACVCVSAAIVLLYVVLFFRVPQFIDSQLSGNVPFSATDRIKRWMPERDRAARRVLIRTDWSIDVQLDNWFALIGMAVVARSPANWMKSLNWTVSSLRRQLIRLIDYRDSWSR